MYQQTLFDLIRRDAGRIDPSHDFIICLLRWQVNGEVTQTHCIGGWRWGTFALPGVQSKMVMIATCRDEPHLEFLFHSHNIKANDAMIKIDCFVHIPHMPMDMSDARFRWNRNI